jgi:membrane protease YdiL (CAAX protease family)
MTAELRAGVQTVRIAPSPELRQATIHRGQGWFRLVLGLFLVFGLFHWSATILGSDRGQRGILIGTLIVAATAAAERFLLRRRGYAIVRQLGLGLPNARGIVAAIGVAVVLWIIAMLFVRARGMTFTFYPGWVSLLPGLFAQAGIAEEVLFRGYLFRHVRAGRTFWHAAAVSMLPFVCVHLVLFLSMPWPIALASVLLAVVISFPLAHLFELGGNTIWPPALLHFVVQATVKVVVFSDRAESFALVWMAASATIPLLVFAVKSPAIARDDDSQFSENRLIGRSKG